jgi:osmotically-inducible protein OsmY
MADRNKNMGDDWDQNRNRFNQENDFNQRKENRGNTGYSGQIARGRETESQGIYNSGRYNEYDRVNYFPDNDENRNYNDRDYENTQYGTSGTYGYRGNRGEYAGNYNQGGYDNRGNYGNRNYGNDYNRQDINEGYGRNRYGGDTRNYGNANQGGFDRDWWDRTKDEVASWFGDDEAERRRQMDRRYMRGHRGKGPKNYHRSEERIREEVCDRLADDDMVDASEMEVQVQGREVILTGYVPSREQKRRAEDIVESVSSVRNVENRLRVGHEQTESTTTGSIGATGSSMT